MKRTEWLEAFLRRLTPRKRTLEGVKGVVVGSGRGFYDNYTHRGSNHGDYETPYYHDAIAYALKKAGAELVDSTNLSSPESTPEELVSKGEVDFVVSFSVRTGSSYAEYVILRDRGETTHWVRMDAELTARDPLTQEAKTRSLYSCDDKGLGDDCLISARVRKGIRRIISGTVRHAGQ